MVSVRTKRVDGRKNKKQFKYIERRICICYNASRQNDISYSLAISSVNSDDLTLRKTPRALPLRVFLFRFKAKLNTLKM